MATVGGVYCDHDFQYDYSDSSEDEVQPEGPLRKGEVLYTPSLFVLQPI